MTDISESSFTQELYEFSIIHIETDCQIIICFEFGNFLKLLSRRIIYLVKLNVIYE